MTEGNSKGTFWTTLPGILTGLAAVIAAVGTTVGGLAALGVFDDAGSSESSSAPTATIRPTPIANLVSCGGDLETGVWGNLSISQPSYVALRDMCVTSLTLYETTAGSGTATIKLEGSTVYSIDLDNFDSLGEQGGGSGERYIRMRAIGVASGQTLALDLSDCVSCGGLTVSFEAAPR